MTNQEDILITPSSDSFWEIGKYNRTVKRIDNGYKLCDSLRSLIDQRSEIEKNYAKQLTQWAKKWNDYLDKGPEYGTTQGAWRGLLCEADSLANLHTLVAENLMTKVYQSIKQWQKDNYHKSMMHYKETKEAEDGFKKAQKPWEKIYTKLQTAKKEFHNACRAEKSTANQENNARGDSAVSPDQLKKIQEKLKKCQADVESTREKYNAYLNDLNSYNPKYMEDMTLVFNKCQDAEKQRQEFFKKTLYDIHECVDLSSEPKFSQVYTELHNTISRADCNQDLAWWSANHGVEMPMKWPTFEDYSPDLASISKKEKKSSQMGSDGIMITSIRHKTDSYNPPQQQETPAYNSQRSSQMSNNSATNNEGYTGPYSGTSSEQPTATESYSSDLRNRKASYDKKLNPFGSDDDESEKEPSPSKETPNQIDPIPEPVTNDTVENPFGDDEDDDDDKVPRECNILMKALYDYDAVEEDEISFKAGDVFTMILTKDEMNWCRGKTEAGDIGHFPAGYAEEYHP